MTAALSADERAAFAHNARRCFERRFHIDIAAGNILSALERGARDAPEELAA